KMPKMGDVAAQEVAARRATSARVAAAIEDAERLYREGKFAEGATRLVRVLMEEGTREGGIAQIQGLLASCYVAPDQPGPAVRAFREVLARQPKIALDPAEVSPKIRAALEEARKPDGSLH